MIWTNETILQIVPDTITLERAKGLSTLRAWALLEGNEKWLWGKCKSSGNTHYEVAADLKSKALYCNCPSRKRPCKHAIALILIYIESSFLFKITEDCPSWVSKQSTGKDITPSVLSGEENPSSSHLLKDLGKRLEWMKSGAQELDVWLKDMVRQGLAGTESQPESFWRDFAARMVDAKLGSIGRRIRLFEQFLHRPDWHDKLLSEMAELFLFAKGFQKYETLPAPLQQELLTYAGVSIRKDELLTQKGESDHWLVIGKQEGLEENLRFRRSWLLGEKTGKIAMILDFVFGQQAFPMSWAVGNVLTGELVFYPSAYPVRALIKRFNWDSKPFEGLKGFSSIEEFAGHYSQAVAANPWLFNFPLLLEQVSIALQKEELVLLDRENNYLPVNCTNLIKWKLMAISGGNPLYLFGEWDGYQLNPLSTFANGRLVELTS